MEFRCSHLLLELRCDQDFAQDIVSGHETVRVRNHDIIDADKVTYDEYYEKSLMLLRKGGLIAIDNILLHGAVVDPSILYADMRARIKDDEIIALKKLNEKIRDDNRVDLSILPMADGITLVRKI